MDINVFQIITQVGLSHFKTTQKRMKRTVIVLTLFFALTINVSGQNSEEKLVRKAFDSYKTSILNDKGEEAVKYVDKRTIK